MDFLCPPGQSEHSDCSSSLPTPVISRLMFSRCDPGVVYLTVVSVYIPLRMVVLKSFSWAFDFCITSLMKCLSKSLAHFVFSQLPFSYQFIHLGGQSFVKYTCCNYIFLIYDLPFLFSLLASFDKELLDFNIIQLIHFSLVSEMFFISFL